MFYEYDPIGILNKFFNYHSIYTLSTTARSTCLSKLYPFRFPQTLAKIKPAYKNINGNEWDHIHYSLRISYH